MSKFPEVQGGGSLILAWQIKDKHVLVIGGGEVSDQHFLHPFALLEAVLIYIYLR